MDRIWIEKRNLDRLSSTQALCLVTGSDPGPTCEAIRASGLGVVAAPVLAVAELERIARDPRPGFETALVLFAGPDSTDLHSLSEPPANCDVFLVTGAGGESPQGGAQALSARLIEWAGISADAATTGAELGPDASPLELRNFLGVALARRLRLRLDALAAMYSEGQAELSDLQLDHARLLAAAENMEERDLPFRRELEQIRSSRSFKMAQVASKAYLRAKALRQD